MAKKNSRQNRPSESRQGEQTPAYSDEPIKTVYRVDGRKIFNFLIVSLLVLAVAGTLLLKSYLFSDYTKSEIIYSGYVDKNELTDNRFIKNILLIGQDTKTLDYDSRSDTMLLLSLNTKERSIKLVSFLRDTYIQIPGHYPNKLNASCAFGGPSLLIETLEYNFDIRIDGYIRIGFNLLADIVDAIGGVTVPEIDETESAALYAGYKVELGPGVNIHLNGENTLRYCRIRQYQSDFSRTERQREVVMQILKDFSVKDIFPLLREGQALISQIDCSFSESELFGLAAQGLFCLKGGMEQQHIPADGTWWDEIVDAQAVLQIDLHENKNILQEFIYG